MGHERTPSSRGCPRALTRSSSTPCSTLRSGSILVLSPSGVVDYANPAALAALATTPEELLGWPVDALLPTLAAEVHELLTTDDLVSVLPRLWARVPGRSRIAATAPPSPSRSAWPRCPRPDGLWVLAGLTDVSPETPDRGATGCAQPRPRRARRRSVRRSSAPTDPTSSTTTPVGSSMEPRDGRRRGSGWSGGPVASRSLPGRATSGRSRRRPRRPLGHARPGHVVTKSTLWLCADLEAETSAPWAAWAREQRGRVRGQLPPARRRTRSSRSSPCRRRAWS